MMRRERRVTNHERAQRQAGPAGTRRKKLSQHARPLFLLIVLTVARQSAHANPMRAQVPLQQAINQQPTTTVAPAPVSSQQAVQNVTNTNSSSTQPPAALAPASTDCPAACTNSEYLNILNKISLNVDVIRDFQRTESSVAVASSANRSSESSPQASVHKFTAPAQQIRPECVRQLIQMIKNLASGELEMKTLLEFASSTSQINLRSDLGYLRASYASDRDRELDKRRQAEQRSGCQQPAGAGDEYYLLGDEPATQAADVDKGQFLPKLVASVDQWLDTFERFTVTREWGALMRVVSGAESILNMFANTTSALTSSAGASKPQGNNKLTKSLSQLATIQKATGLESELLQSLERELPGQVQALSSSLNQLFPWHVWPWNNVDLYATIDTFLNHGIFAFSKTTAGPERRIDYLPQMLEALFKSLRQDSFPKKCNDWSRIICDLELFYDRLLVAPATGADGASEPTSAELAKRKQQVNELIGANSTGKLTQELVCIMFSSLSMQQFGAKDVDLSVFDQESAERASAEKPAPAPANSSGGATLASQAAAGGQLKWSRQIRKGLKLYKLSREALTDEQWMALYRQFNELWSQMKISDRVIMVGRIIQLLTNCHMPRELLETALWKDIYKYKNALNQMGDIIIEELNRSSENGKFTIGQLALGSKHLEDILTRFVSLLPRLVEALSHTLTNELPELVGKFFDEKIAFFKGPCKGHSLSELLPSLARYRAEMVELERLVCQQLRTKPSIIMSQFNNLTNEFLAMALNFTNFGGPLQSLPRLWNANQPPVGGVAATRQNVSSSSVARAAAAAARRDDKGEESGRAANETSIIDELAANPRLAQIVAILQSSALDPPEVHAELPELDWVEAGTSVALFYETIQKLLSYEGPFQVFPEVREFQEEMRARLETSKRMFTKFSKKDPTNLVAYSLDTLMPVALRTFQPLDSFHSECLATFRDLFGELEFVEARLAPGGAHLGQPGSRPAPAPAAASRESRQWQCAVSATNFASFALNELIRTFNAMLKNILNQMSRQRDLYQFQQAAAGAQPANQSAAAAAGPNMTICVLFDGSISTLMDNLPHLLDLGLETVLIASTNTNQRLTLKETLCSFENTLDPLGEPQYLQRQFKLREAICHLLHESSLATCYNALKLDLWTATMRQLNSSWFEASAISVEPSFRAIIKGVHEFLDLFGKVKPSSMSDGLIARVLNFNSYWTGLMNKAVSSVEKYREKRFQLALQILMPIIYDNLPLYSDQTNRSAADETKLALKTSILSARATFSYLGGESAGGAPASEQQMRALLEWADENAIAISETLIFTVATNLTKFEQLFNSSSGAPSNAANHTWGRFCAAPLDAYLQLDGLPTADNTTSESRLLQLASAKDTICRFEWALMRERLFQQANLSPSSPKESGTSVAAQNVSSSSLGQHSTRQLVRVSLTKWGQVLDLVSSSAGGASARPRAGRMPRFISLAYWQPLQTRLAQLTPSEYDPTNFIWLWRAVERLVTIGSEAERHHYELAAGNSSSSAAAVAGGSPSAEALGRIFEQLNCALDAIKGGITWDNMVNIYQDRQDVLAAHTTLNNGIALVSAGASTFLAHKRFQQFLNQFVKPRMGLSAFCEVRDKARLESIFAPEAPARPHRSDEDLGEALESLQEFICDTNLETFVQNINPISICYHQMAPPTGPRPANTSATTTPAPAVQQQQQQPQATLADSIDRFAKLASLAIMDAKLVDTSHAKPPIFEKSQWEQLRAWWLNQTEAHQGNSGLALALVRLFQTLDSINSEHVVWRAVFRSVHELSEVSAYLVRAAEMERQASLEQHERGQPTKLALIREAAEQVDSAMKDNKAARNATGAIKLAHKQHQLASTMANVMFPEVSNFISFKTFKQLRYIKSISEYFASEPEAQSLICKNFSTRSAGAQLGEEEEARDGTSLDGQRSKFELIDYKLDTSKRLYSLLCHYRSSQWLTAMNIVLSSRTSSLSKKVNYMTKYLLIFTKNFQLNENLQSFIHGQQLENIEAVANTTVSYLIALTQPLRQLTLGKISNITWHSIPVLLDSIDGHLCASKNEQQQPQPLQSVDGKSSQHQHHYQLAVYEPKKPDIETLICKLPSWNISQVYSYVSENIDLQNMISLATQNNRTASFFGLSIGGGPSSPMLGLTSGQQNATSKSQPKTCITPFKFASKWLKIAQDLIDELMSKASREKIRKCLNANKKGQSVYVQTLRYVKVLNSLLATINDLTINSSWPIVRRTWNSISYAILSQTGQTTMALPVV